MATKVNIIAEVLILLREGRSFAVVVVSWIGTEVGIEL